MNRGSAEASGGRVIAMKSSVHIIATLALLAAGAHRSWSQKTVVVPLDKLEKERPLNVKTEVETYKGLKSLRVVDAAPPDAADGIQLVVLNDTSFRDGTIEIEIAGVPVESASSTARGFVGLAFRVDDTAQNALRYEAFYIRPTNGRVDDQIRRNHATQYIAYPDFPWFQLRKDFPGKYESYADMVPGEWTKVKIVVRGNEARLYIQGAEQPALVVTDLKHGEGQGKIALWVGTETLAHFANLRITQ
jgi:hypothetical protein